MKISAEQFDMELALNLNEQDPNWLSRAMIEKWAWVYAETFNRMSYDVTGRYIL